MDPWTCAVCGQPLAIGDWPYCPHGKSVQTSPFKAIFDYGLGRAPIQTFR